MLASLGQLVERFDLAFLGVNFPLGGPSQCLSQAGVHPADRLLGESEAGVSPSLPWMLGRPERGCAHLSPSDCGCIACRRQSGLLGLAIERLLPPSKFKSGLDLPLYPQFPSTASASYACPTSCICF